MKVTYQSKNGTLYNSADYALRDGARHCRPTWKAAIHGWISRWHITGETTPVYEEAINEWRSLKDMHGDEWQSVLIAFGYKNFNDLFDTQFYANQIPYYEE